MTSIHSASPWISRQEAVVGANLQLPVGWVLMALSTQFRSYCTLKIKLYYKYKNFIDINSWSKITKNKKNMTIIVDLD